MKAKYIAMLAGVAATFMGTSIAPTPAIAQVEFEFGTGGGRSYDNRRYYRDDYRDEYREDRRYDRRSAYRGCSPRQALSAASRWLDDPRIRSVNRAYYDIDGYGKSGRNRGRPDGVRISTAPDCERSRP
ncbi:hypothetical protein [Neorhizobium galegae]|uniref:hypothetical protein n=1 Tax=Neorhizobium galegae TaxID=399 RepID=UPI0012FE8912|nr:hypothetical protein [Neorhizobium galegae]MCQ1852739.1 hypothetical protein [Neorhizobium galegae]